MSAAHNAWLIIFLLPRLTNYLRHSESAKDTTKANSTLFSDCQRLHWHCRIKNQFAQVAGERANNDLKLCYVLLTAIYLHSVNAIVVYSPGRIEQIRQIFYATSATSADAQCCRLIRSIVLWTSANARQSGSCWVVESQPPLSPSRYNESWVVCSAKSQRRLLLPQFSFLPARLFKSAVPKLEPDWRPVMAMTYPYYCCFYWATAMTVTPTAAAITAIVW